MDGRKVVFAVSARDEVEPIGKGKHTRAVIEAARFMRRVNEKARGA